MSDNSKVLRILQNFQKQIVEQVLRSHEKINMKKSFRYDVKKHCYIHPKLEA